MMDLRTLQLVRSVKPLAIAVRKRTMISLFHMALSALPFIQPKKIYINIYAHVEWNLLNELRKRNKVQEHECEILFIIWH